MRELEQRLTDRTMGWKARQERERWTVGWSPGRQNDLGILGDPAELYSAVSQQGEGRFKQKSQRFQDLLAIQTHRVAVKIDVTEEGTYFGERHWRQDLCGDLLSAGRWMRGLGLTVRLGILDLRVTCLPNILVLEVRRTPDVRQV